MKKVYATKTKDAAQNAQIKRTIMQGSQNQQSAQELAAAFDKGKTVNIQAL